MIIEKTENGIYKMLDLSELPKKKWGQKEIIDWKACNDSPVNYIWGEKLGKMTFSFSKIEKKRTYIKISLQNQKENHVREVGNISRLDIGGIFREKIPDFLHKYILHPEDASLSRKSGKEISCVCPVCNSQKKMVVASLTSRGFTCPTCRPNSSFPERVGREILRQNNISFYEQYVFPELPRRYFDFFLPELNTCIEIHGRQHYKPEFGEEVFARTKKSDKVKRDFCRDNNYTLVEINASKNTIPDIANNFKESILKLEVKNQQKLVEGVLTNKNTIDYQEIIKKYNQEEMTITKIAKLHNLSENGVFSILKRFGVHTELGKKVVCLEGRILFNSVTQAARETNTSHYKLSTSIKNKSPYGTNISTGKQLTWLYYDDYIKKYEKDNLKEYVTGDLGGFSFPKKEKTVPPRKKGVVCLNDKVHYSTITLAKKVTGAHGISRACKTKEGTAGKHLKTGEPLQWLYYEDYIKKYGVGKVSVYNNPKVDFSRTVKAPVVVCLNNRMCYNKTKTAAEHMKCSYSGLTSHLKGRTESCGRDPNTNDKLRWMRYSDYIEKYGTEGLTEYVEDKRELL